MRVMHGAIRDGHIFRRPVDPPPVGVLAGFENNAIVAGVNVAVGNPHVAAGINGDAVGVHAGIGLDDDVLDHRIVRVEEVNRPHRRTDKMNAFDQDIRAVHEADEGGPEFRRRLLIILLRRGRFHFEVLQQMFPVGAEGGPDVGIRGIGSRHELEPRGVVRGQHAAARDGDVMQMPSANQRDRRETFDALLAALE